MSLFRTLRADEIDCRINQISEKGLSLLLYKDARCDMDLLDEAVGPMNWTRRHERDNANCIVSIYDENKKEWISKEDTGTESNTEKEKGLASDSFKRACINWGIGRELYTAPRIWLSADKVNIRQGRNGKPACYDEFTVSEISYNDAREIIRLVICKDNVPVFVYGDRPPMKQEAAAPAPKKVAKKKKDPEPKEEKPASETGPIWFCSECGEQIRDTKLGDKEYTAKKIAETYIKRLGRPLCIDCAQAMLQKQEKESENA